MLLDSGVAATTSAASDGAAAAASLQYVTGGLSDIAAAASTAPLQDTAATAAAVAAATLAAGDSGSLYSPGVSATIIIFLALITAVSIGGNVLVCVAILTDRRLRKVSNLFLVSLAVADLVVSCLVMPFAIANDVLGYWPFDEHFCSRWLSLDILSATASILNLCAISLDRYVHMKSPFVYEQWMTTRRCLLFIAVTWLASLLISFLPLELGWHVDTTAVADAAAVSVADNSSAVFSWPTTPPLAADAAAAVWTEAASNSSLSEMSGDARAVAAPAGLVATCALQINPVYAIVSSSVSFYIPCIVMLGIYGQVYKLARHHAVSIKRTQAYEAALAAAAGGGAQRKSVQENKALFTLGIIMGLFLISWFPFFIVNVVQAFCHQCAPGELMQAFIWLGYFNSTQNPIIYSIFNLDFREAFRRILTCERLRKRDPYGSLGGNGGGKSHRNGAAGRGAAPGRASRSVVQLAGGAASDGRRSAPETNGKAAEEHIPMKDLRVAASSGAKRDDVNDNTLHVNGDGERLLNGHRGGSGGGGE